MRPAFAGIVSVLGVVFASSGCSSQVRTVDSPDATRAVSAGMAPSSTMPEPPGAAPEQAPEPVPSACTSQDGSVCLPSTSFVQRLCSSPNPDAALAMFAKGTPWTRGYLRRPTEAWDAIRGGREAQQMKLGEEVLVIAHRGAPKGEMSVGTGGNYDVLRWNGACVSLMEDEVGLRKPSQPT